MQKRKGQIAALALLLLLHYLLLFGLPLPKTWYLALLVKCLIYLLPAWLGYLVLPSEKKELSPLWIWQMGSALGLACLSSLLVYGVRSLFNGFVQETVRSLPLLLSLLLAGVLEEIFYRGAVLPALLPFGVHSGVWLSAALFALGHELPFSALFALLCGGALGYLRVYSRRLLPCVALHLEINLLSYWMLPATLWFQGVVYGCGAALGLICLGITFRKTKEKKENCRDTGSELYDVSTAGSDVGERSR